MERWKNKPAKTVDEYLAPLPKDVKAALEDLRRVIKAAAPEAEEVISYQMPAYKHKGLLVFFAAFKDHCSFFVGGRSILKTIGKDLEKYDTSGTAIHFTPENPLPASLVKKIVKARIAENELRARLKAKRR